MDTSTLAVIAQTPPSADGAFLEMIAAFARAVEVRDQYTGAHVLRVGRSARRIGEVLGLSAEELWNLEAGAVLHDVGKIGVPDAILAKEERLTEAEWEVVRRHPTLGHAVLEGVSVLRPAIDGVLHHHESWDGSGYPTGLAGEDIPLAGRVIAVADAFDAMTSWRPYRPARPLRAAVRAILSDRGARFDPTVVEAFLATLPRGLVDAALPSRADIAPSPIAERTRDGTPTPAAVAALRAAVRSAVDGIAAER